MIRTQPTEESVSTLEAIAIALSQIENKPDIVEVSVVYPSQNISNHFALDLELVNLLATLWAKKE